MKVTGWLKGLEVTAGGTGSCRCRTAGAMNTAWRVAWAQVEARHGVLPGVAIADKVLEG